MSELPDTNAEEALRWLAQADEEALAAGHIAADSELPPRIACFLCHLAAEKALKAWLIALARPFRKVHDLRALLELLPEASRDAIRTDDLDQLNPWVTEGRYPGDVSDATHDEATRCIDAVERVVGAARAGIEAQGS